jgi:3-hydroxymyristoyl/3-hydroxydecanoyl-(acyl carrier protein) dehydratase
MSRMEFDFRVAAGHPSLPGHFPGRPLVPGVLLLDHVLQAVSRLTGQDVTRLRQVKFTSALLPGEQAHGFCEVEGARVTFRVATQREGAEVVVAEGLGSLSARMPL